MILVSITLETVQQVFTLLTALIFQACLYFHTNTIHTNSMGVSMSGQVQLCPVCLQSSSQLGGFIMVAAKSPSHSRFS